MINSETLQFTPDRHAVLIAAGWDYREPDEGAGVAGMPNRTRYIRSGTVLAPFGFGSIDIFRPNAPEGKKRRHNFKAAATLDGFRRQVLRQTKIADGGAS